MPLPALFTVRAVILTAAGICAEARPAAQSWS